MSYSLARRLKAIKDEMPEICKLVAVSKGHSSEKIIQLVELGQRDFGESRVQEAIQTQKLLKKFNLCWHFIGRIQSNKIRKLVRSFEVIHSVDTLTIAKKISKKENMH